MSVVKKAVSSAIVLAALGKIAFDQVKGLSARISNVKRLDENGALYYFEYEGNYDDLLTKLPIKILSKCGCSAFISHNQDDDVITGRNYDLAHTDKNKKITGLNTVFKLHPQGKYSSINMADACWFSVLKLPYYMGALDDGKTTLLPLYLLPYFCMDGINEKGLTVSILYLDIKEGEKAVEQSVKGKKTIVLTQLMRYMLDNCKDIEEAIDLAGQYNITNTLKSDYHLFITDEKGNSAVLEWRYNTFTVTRIDAATNFYHGYDDSCDCYYGEKLKERFIQPKETIREYHYGYGHGYGRFNTMAQCLQQHMIDRQSMKTQMSDEEAANLLAQVSQEYDETDISSHTQYSALYNNTKRCVDIWLLRDYCKKYHFDL